MWTLYAFATFGFLGYFLNKVYKKFYPSSMKSFTDVYEKDEYNLLCYRIIFEDDIPNLTKLELTDEEIKQIDEENKIKYINIDYMFNGKFMKYITYEKDITFPFYVFKALHLRVLNIIPRL